MTSLALARHTPGRRRLRQLTGPRAAAPVGERLTLAEAPGPVVKRLSGALPKSVDDRSRLRRRLAAAGYDSMAAAVLFSWARIVVPIVCAAVPIVVFGVASGWLVAAAA